MVGSTDRHVATSNWCSGIFHCKSVEDLQSSKNKKNISICRRGCQMLPHFFELSSLIIILLRTIKI